MTVSIGLDFDNTIVCYDTAIKTLAFEKYGIREPNFTKENIKSELIARFGSDAWTEFQGELYGPGMRYAKPYANALKTIKKLKELNGVTFSIISHRTKFPFVGKKYQLHSYAKDWVIRYGLLGSIFDSNQINFFESKEEKVRAIIKHDCAIFLDDLPDILNHRLFPKNTMGILFDPKKRKQFTPRISNWTELEKFV